MTFYIRYSSQEKQISAEIEKMQNPLTIFLVVGFKMSAEIEKVQNSLTFYLVAGSKMSAETAKT